MALFKDEDDESNVDGDGSDKVKNSASFISGYTTPGPKERATSAKKKVIIIK